MVGESKFQENAEGWETSPIKTALNCPQECGDEEPVEWYQEWQKMQDFNSCFPTFLSKNSTNFFSFYKSHPYRGGHRENQMNKRKKAEFRKKKSPKEHYFSEHSLNPKLFWKHHSICGIPGGLKPLGAQHRSPNPSQPWPAPSGTRTKRICFKRAQIKPKRQISHHLNEKTFQEAMGKNYPSVLHEWFLSA